MGSGQVRAAANTARDIRGRFAPSPTGDLHLGNVWTALLAWLYTRQQGGQFILRIEDLDPERSRLEVAQQHIIELRWLGLDWDEGPDIGGAYTPYIQSDRTERYEAALEHLQSLGLIYPCYCTRAEIRAAASAPHGEERGNDYPGTCRNLTAAERQEREAQGRRPALRVHLPHTPTPIEFDDMVCGPQCDDIAAIGGDFVIRRADGVHAYQLAVVVDDGQMAISHVIRGADLLSSTARQIWLYRLLNYPVPSFGHVPLLIDSEGYRLSKRQASLSVAALRAQGFSPQQIIGSLAYRAGLIDRPCGVTPDDLLRTLDLTHLPHTNISILLPSKPAAGEIFHDDAA